MSDTPLTESEPLSNAKIFTVHDGSESFTYAALDAESVLAHHRSQYDDDVADDAEVEGPMPDNRRWKIKDEDGSGYWRGDSVDAIAEFVGRDLNPGEVIDLWSTCV